MATKVSFVALSEPVFYRLDIFSNARLLKITLVRFFFCDIHCLPSLRTSLGRKLTQSAFSFCPNRSFLMQKSDPPAGGAEKLT